MQGYCSPTNNYHSKYQVSRFKVDDFFTREVTYKESSMVAPLGRVDK